MSKKYKNLVRRRLYNRFHDIKRRCYNPENHSYRSYGGRGITICDEWLQSFDSFYEWAMKSGYKDGLTIDRIDPDGPYSPENCQWLTIIDNCDSKRKRDRTTKTKKLTEETVKYIHAHPEKSSSELASELNVRRSTVWNVRSGATWPEYHPALHGNYERGGALLKRVDWKPVREKHIRYSSYEGQRNIKRIYNLGMPDFCFQGVKVVNRDGQWWFNLYDVMDLMGYSESSKKVCISFLEYKPKECYRKIETISPSGVLINMYYINKIGLYAFAEESHKGVNKLACYKLLYDANRLLP